MNPSDKDRPLFGKVVTVVGGSGFVGAHLAQELLSRGARVRIASRAPRQAFQIKPLGNLGQVQFVRTDITKRETLPLALIGSDAVVNLVGAFSGDLDAVQGSGAGDLAAAARDAGAGAFVHVSAIGADAGSKVAYARTKARGETAVSEAFDGATIIRPSIMFGPDDQFVQRFAGLIAALPVLPVFAPAAKLQPVFVDDVAEAIATVLCDPPLQGGTYELGGPETMTMADFNRRIAAAQHRERGLVELPDAVSRAFATLTGWLPGAPISRDQLTLLEAGNVESGSLPGFGELGLTPRPLGLFLDRWMVSFRKHGRFGTRISPTSEGHYSAGSRK